MTEQSFRLAIWSAAINALRALGLYWHMCDSVEIVRNAGGTKSVIVTESS